MFSAKESDMRLQGDLGSPLVDAHTFLDMLHDHSSHSRTSISPHDIYTRDESMDRGVELTRDQLEGVFDVLFGERATQAIEKWAQKEEHLDRGRERGGRGEGAGKYGGGGGPLTNGSSPILANRSFPFTAIEAATDALPPDTAVVLRQGLVPYSSFVTAFGIASGCSVSLDFSFLVAESIIGMARHMAREHQLVMPLRSLFKEYVQTDAKAIPSTKQTRQAARTAPLKQSLSLFGFRRVVEGAMGPRKADAIAVENLFYDIITLQPTRNDASRRGHDGLYVSSSANRSTLSIQRFLVWLNGMDTSVNLDGSLSLAAPVTAGKIPEANPWLRTRSIAQWLWWHVFCQLFPPSSSPSSSES